MTSSGGVGQERRIPYVPNRTQQRHCLIRALQLITAGVMPSFDGVRLHLPTTALAGEMPMPYAAPIIDTISAPIASEAVAAGLGAFNTCSAFGRVIRQNS